MARRSLLLNVSAGTVRHRLLPNAPASLGGLRRGVATSSSPSYDSHVPTTPKTKISMAFKAAVGAFMDPTRADLVAQLGEVTGEVALNKMHARMMEDEAGRTLLQNKPRVNQEQLCFDALNRLPEDTFGFHYAQFMAHHHFSPDERDIVKYVDNAEHAYVMQRYREVHDFWHVLCGVPPSVLGEVALKWFEMIQTGLPVAALSAFVGPLRLTPREIGVLNTVYIPWAARSGKNSRFLLNVQYEDELQTPLHELRAKLNLEPAPEFDSE